jgi:hypothetical protein
MNVASKTPLNICTVSRGENNNPRSYHREKLKPHRNYEVRHTYVCTHWYWNSWVNIHTHDKIRTHNSSTCSHGIVARRFRLLCVTLQYSARVNYLPFLPLDSCPATAQISRSLKRCAIGTWALQQPILGSVSVLYHFLQKNQLKFVRHENLNSNIGYS